MKRLHAFLRFLGSFRVGIAVLCVLSVLVFWGTLFEARAGMEWGTERFFGSWFLWVAGIFPFPAMKTVALFLFFHLLLAVLFCIPHTWKHGGILLVHVSVMVLVLGSLVGGSFRKSFEAFGIEGSEIVLDPSRETSLRVLKADSAECLIESPADRNPRRVAWNEPQDVGAFTVYFGEVHALSLDAKAVRFLVKRDPFAFVPYLFSFLLGVGILWCAAAKIRKVKS